MRTIQQRRIKHKIEKDFSSHSKLALRLKKLKKVKWSRKWMSSRNLRVTWRENKECREEVVRGKKVKRQNLMGF